MPAAPPRRSRRLRCRSGSTHTIRASCCITWRRRISAWAITAPPRIPLIVEALAGLRSRSCIIDGEAVACGEDGIASFSRIRYRRHDADVFLYAFDLIELNGDDLRHDPLAVRKATLVSVLARAAPGLR